MKSLTLAILAICNLALPALAKAMDLSKDPYCYDQDKTFKRCRDQQAILEINKLAAIQQNKLVLIVYGHEACSWSRSIIKSLYFSENAKSIQSKFIVTPIAHSTVYHSGKELISNLRTLLDQQEFANKGIPQLVVMNPVNGKGSFIDLEPFERNTDETEIAPAYNGYQVEDVFKKINEVSALVQ